MPGDGPRMASEAPSGPGWGHPTGEGPRGPRRAVCGLRGASPEAGPRQAGACAFGDGPEQLRNVDVAKIPESMVCDLRLTFAKSGLKS